MGRGGEGVARQLLGMVLVLMAPLGSISTPPCKSQTGACGQHGRYLMRSASCCCRRATSRSDDSLPSLDQADRSGKQGPRGIIAWHRRHEGGAAWRRPALPLVRAWRRRHKHVQAKPSRLARCASHRHDHAWLVMHDWIPRPILCPNASTHQRNPPRDNCSSAVPAPRSSVPGAMPPPPNAHTQIAHT